ncbi:hypothetical protein KAX35_10320, partial [candidate division WOR-3 bacterium]|nr:hypothetical protein [candidate division WOR-3 bacterium]
MMRLLIFTTVFVVAVSIPVSATIINVPDDCSTIQEGIDASSDGDTVLVQPDTYVENINFNGHNIILGSLFLTTGDTSYISSTNIDGDSSGTVVSFENGEDSTAVIAGFTIQNGAALHGGGIYCLGASPSLVNVTISGNTARSGGGIYGGKPSLENVTISGNTADIGGGIHCGGGSSSLENATISGNTARIGGGIHWGGGSPSLVNVNISGNTASSGGGISCWAGSPSLKNVTISGNTAGWGGGIDCELTDLSLENVTISGNTAGGCGGGIYFLYSSSSLVNVTISGNTAGSGGGICCYDCNPSLELENVTIGGNTAGRGGGIFCSGWDGPSLVNCILWNDTPQEIYIYSGSVTATYSDIQGGWTGTGNIDEDPMFVSGPLGDYHLCPFTPSPCIDAGNPDPMYNDPEDPLIPGYAMWPALGTVRNDMGVYGGPNTDVWTGVEEDEDLLPSTFFLKQNYPNPFKLQTT